MADTEVVHIEDTANADTTTAPNGIRVDYVISGVKHDNGALDLTVSIKTTNFAFADNAVGAVKVSLLNGGAVVWSMLVQSPRNPGKGLAAPTQRDSSSTEKIPAGVSFDQIAANVLNLDHPGPADVNLGAILAVALIAVAA